MTPDIDQHFEDLAKRWPDLYEKANVDYFGVEIGWTGIIDTLCSLISHRVESAKRRLKFALECPTPSGDPEYIPKLEKEVADALEDLPTIMQVKEKFGGLRFYVNGASDEVHNYIDFAESMSFRVCEMCGAPGEPRSDGWTKTLCERHHRERHEESEPYVDPVPTGVPRLAEE
jgi:hypothetical protein